MKLRYPVTMFKLWTTHDPHTLVLVIGRPVIQSCQQLATLSTEQFMFGFQSHVFFLEYLHVCCNHLLLVLSGFAGFLRRLVVFSPFLVVRRIFLLAWHGAGSPARVLAALVGGRLLQTHWCLVVVSTSLFQCSRLLRLQPGIMTSLHWRQRRWFYTTMAEWCRQQQSIIWAQPVCFIPTKHLQQQPTSKHHHNILVSADIICSYVNNVGK